MAEMTWWNDGDNCWARHGDWYITKNDKGDYSLRFDDWDGPRIGFTSIDPERLKALAQRLQDVIDEQETDRG